jgi:hypothetical protein
MRPALSSSSALATGNPDIDMVALLGSDTRFSSSARSIVLSSQLGRGVDEWVFAVSASIKSLLLAGKATVSAVNCSKAMTKFNDFLTQGALKDAEGIRLLSSRPASPNHLKPLHIEQFIEFLKKAGVANGDSKSTTRNIYQGVKTTVLSMFSLSLIPGEPYRFFRPSVFGRDGESDITSMSDDEQERLASVIKNDLSAIHHGRLQVTMRELQALRLLVVAHRMGYNTTPLLELTRDSIQPGLLPGTIRIRTVKGRGKKIASLMGSDGSMPSSLTLSAAQRKARI